MKNIHLIPTYKPSRLYTLNSSKKLYYTNNNLNQIKFTVNQNIYITSDEEIKEPCWCWDILQKKIYWVHDTLPKYPTIGNYFKKIILTTDQDLIKDGVQAIDDEFLNWFVKNPNCEEVEVKKECCGQCDERLCEVYDLGIKELDYKITIPKEEPKQTDENGKPLTYWGGLAEHKQETLEEEPKQITSLDGDGLGGIPKGILTMLIGEKEETLKEAAEKYVNINVAKNAAKLMYKEHFIAGAKWQQEQDRNKFSEKDMISFADFKISNIMKHSDKKGFYLGTKKVLEIWFEQFKKK